MIHFGCPFASLKSGAFGARSIIFQSSLAARLRMAATTASTRFTVAGDQVRLVFHW
ncbi:MAG: hypothetical protein ACREUG_03900 [Steroidobacteraceae bacterium]